jgi:hypothetical protein
VLPVVLAGDYFADHPEHDTMCCEGSQTYKQCKIANNLKADCMKHEAILSREMEEM